MSRGGSPRGLIESAIAAGTRGFWAGSGDRSSHWAAILIMPHHAESPIRLAEQAGTGRSETCPWSLDILLADSVLHLNPHVVGRGIIRRRYGTPEMVPKIYGFPAPRRLAVELGLPGSRHSLDLDRALALDLQPGAERPGSASRNRSGRDSEFLEQDHDQ